MKEKEEILKKLLLVSIFILLFFPLIQSIFNFKEIKPLRGAVNVIIDTSFNKKDWLAGNYQQKKEDYLNESFGFRNIFIRINNQIAHTLFNKAKANGVIIGKENYLYEENYIKAALGLDFVGEQVIIEHTKRLKVVQEYLKTLNKDLVFVLAPGKGSFFPEFIPDKYSNNKKSKTNYDFYLKEFHNNNINYIDFNNWFRKNKFKSKYPLYSKCGIHWSKYSEMFVADSICSYIENLRLVNLPKLVVDSFIISDENLYEDYDIGDGMNLLFDLHTYPMAYPNFHIEKAENNSQVKSLVIADSYYWGMYNYGISRDIFNNGDFWYYNKQIYPASYSVPLEVSQVNIKEEIAKHDVFIILFTDANLQNFDYGFTDLVYNSINGLPDNIKQERVDFYINKIKSTPEWLESIKNQAKEKNQTIDEAIKENAEYMVFTKG